MDLPAVADHMVDGEIKEMSSYLWGIEKGLHAMDDLKFCWGVVSKNRGSSILSELEEEISQQ